MTSTPRPNRLASRKRRKEVPEHHLACYRAGDGKLVWRTRIPQGKEPMGYAIYAVPTPVTDGKVVYAWFGSAVIAAVDLGGKLLWRHERPGPFNLNPGICQSPILHQDTVILSCDQGRGKGWIQGLDTETGEVKWELKRPRAGCCNATRILVDVKGKTQLVAVGGGIVQGLSPSTGKPIRWCKSRGFGESPVYDSGLIYVDKGLNEWAMCLDPTGEGEVTETHVKWKLDKSPGDYFSPVISGGYIFKVRKQGEILCRKLATGEEAFTAKLEKVSKLASPIATADGRIYFVSTGKSYVIGAAPKLQILGGGNLGGHGNGSSAAVSNGRIFVRDFQFLWCLGKK